MREIDDELIYTIAKDLYIQQELNEDVEQWECRVIYSALGHTALTSLWDTEENYEPISVIHFKQRIVRNYEAYKVLYPLISSFFTVPANELMNELYEIYVSSGYIYHSPNKIVPAIYSKCVWDNVIFLRGIAPGSQVSMSGLGFYSINNKKEVGRLSEMFNLSSQTLEESLKYLVMDANWKNDDIFVSKEYLRLAPPFTHGYWKDNPDIKGEISLLRAGSTKGYIYYLYQYREGKCYVSQIPDWLTKGYEYRKISNWILNALGTLPAIDYCEKRNTVEVKINYLLPPREMCLLKLYSWPQSYRKLPCDFNRVFAKNVFSAIKKCLQQIGYTFRKV